MEKNPDVTKPRTYFASPLAFRDISSPKLQRGKKKLQDTVACTQVYLQLLSRFC